MRGPAAILGLSALLIFMTAAPSGAAQLDLVCRVHWTKAGRHQDGLRRLDIDLSARTVRVSDNLGQGFRLKGQRPIVSADAGRIVLEQGGGKSAYVDRRSGQYMFRNEAEGLVIQGPCAKAAPERRAF